MSALNGTIALYSLHILDANNTKRANNAELYRELLDNIEGITLPTHSNDFKHVYHQYTIRSSKRDELSEILKQNKIGFGVHYRISIHQQEVYTKLGVKDLLETEKASSQVISLPVHPHLSKDQIKFVAETIRKFH